MNVKNFVLGLGIVIVFALVLWQGVETFYPSPMWDDYCRNIDLPVKPGVEESQADCVENNGVWRSGYCDYYYECQQEFDSAQKDRAKIVFFISLIAGIVVIIVGYAILSVEPVGSALIGSGIWAFFYGTVVNWRNITSIWRFLLLLAILILLIWITIRLNTRKEKSFWKRLGLRK